MEVLRLTGQGHSTKRIAELLDISPKMVETHRSKIKSKLKLQTHPEFVQTAVQWVLQNS
jgi:DNA-binding CsgD family transcriptional regulator